MYKTVFFDLDGTLSDSGEGIINSVKYALEKFGIEEKDVSKLRRFIGPPLTESFGELYGFSPEDCDLAIKYYREYFPVKGIYENALYPGVPEMLERLKAAGLRLAVATSKPEDFTREVLRYLGIAEYFDYVAAASMDETRTKKADVIAYGIGSFFGGDGSGIIMVGDHKHDIEGAKENGLDSLAVTYGYGDTAELLTAGPDFVAESVEDIPGLILSSAPELG